MPFYRHSIYIKITTKEKSGNNDRKKPAELTALQDFWNNPAIITVDQFINLHLIVTFKEVKLCRVSCKQVTTHH